MNLQNKKGTFFTFIRNFCSKLPFVRFLTTFLSILLRQTIKFISPGNPILCLGAVYLLTAVG